jgi:hypothetical protein
MDRTTHEGLIGSSEAERLTFVALAQHVLLYRPENAGGLFHRLLTRRLFHFVTQADEEAAQQHLKRYLYGGGSLSLCQPQTQEKQPAGAAP